MKCRRCSYRKRCSGFCSCPDSNWPPRYSYRGNVLYLFACSIIIAYSKTPFSFLPTLHSYCLSVHYHCSATEWHCCLEQKSPLMPYLGDVKSGCDVDFLLSLYQLLSLQNMVTIFCGYFNITFYLVAHTEVFFWLHRCFVTVTDKSVLRLDDLICCLYAYKCMY